MGTGSYEEIDIRIKGNIPFDYEDEVRDYNIFKHKLELLCAEYGLEVEYQ